MRPFCFHLASSTHSHIYTKETPIITQSYNNSPTMQFFTLPALALLATTVLAMPNDLDTRAALEARIDCSRIVPACNGGHIAGQTNCRCKGQKETCDLWTCPGGSPNVVSLSVFAFTFSASGGRFAINTEYSFLSLENKIRLLIGDV